jgi:hypothetical protein
MELLESREAHMTADNDESNAEALPAQGNTRQMKRMVAKFDRTLKRSAGLIGDRFGEIPASVMREEILDEYRRLIPEVPYIGGRSNMFSRTLMGTPQALATHRVVVRHGGTALDTGEFLHRFMRTRLERIPRVLRQLMGRYRFSRVKIRQYERTARQSQKRHYPGDWVLETVDADGADELTPYICDLDLLLAEELGYGLERKRTLSWGCDRCDFRLTKTGVTSAPWPPKFIEATCGEPAIEDRGTMT